MHAWSLRGLLTLPSNLLLTGSISPLRDDTDTVLLVKRQVPLGCVLYRYGSFSLTLDIVRESCLCWGLRKGGISCQGWPVPWEKLLENTPVAERVLGEPPLGFPAYGLGRGILT